MSKIITSLGKFSDAELAKQADYIVVSMNGNPSFPSPQPALPDVEAALDKYKHDLVAASGRDRILVAVKNESRQTLVDLLSRLGLNIMSTAKGDTAKLASTGYPMAKVPEPGFISNPTGIRIRNGSASGQLICSVNPVKYALLYNHEVTTDPPNENAAWTSTRSSKSSHLFTNLQPGVKYWFRVAAIRGNEMAYSQIASMHVQ